MKNNAMIIGAIDAGKTTLMNALLKNNAPALKTQSLSYDEWIVDTPGEYTENPLYYKNIMATSLEVTHVIYVQDATSIKNIFPPGFSLGISKLPIAVVTKSDAETANVEKAINILKKVVVRGPLIITSAINNEGIEHIKPLVECNSLSQMKEYVYKQQTHSLYFIE